MNRRIFLNHTSRLSLGLCAPLLACRSTKPTDSEVLIWGAGLAGLYAAMLLEERGIDCRILEGSNRIGGRLFTRYDLPENPELGAVEVGDAYQRLVALAEQLGIALQPGSPFDRAVYLHVKGIGSSSKDWASHKANTLAPDLRQWPPYLLESTALRGKVPYQSLEDWYKKEYEHFDYSFADFLAKNGYDEEVRQLINTSGNFNDIGNISTAHILRSRAFRTLGGSKSSLRIAGGSSQLPLAMQKRIRGSIDLQKQVVKIVEEKSSVKVTCQDGSSYRAKQVICTLPFPVLQTIQLEAKLSEVQRQAIAGLAYTKITQVIIAPKSKFWETDGLPTTMWTDSPLERIFAIKNKAGEVVQFKAFINGKGAAEVDRLSKKELRELVLKTLYKIRPAAENQLEVLDSFSWTKHPFSKGAYAEFQAGQVKAWVPAMAQSTPRIHFAGEHTSFAEKSMEGALASAERAVSMLAIK